LFGCASPEIEIGILLHPQHGHGLGILLCAALTPSSSSSSMAMADLKWLGRTLSSSVVRLRLAVPLRTSLVLRRWAWEGRNSSPCGKGRGEAAWLAGRRGGTGRARLLTAQIGQGKGGSPLAGEEARKGWRSLLCRRGKGKRRDGPLVGEADRER